MSLYGVWQLLRLRVVYSNRSGSSRGARDFVGNYLPQFRQQNPQFDIVAEERAGHPWLEATYRKNLVKKVEVKNLDALRILERVQRLRDSYGRPSKRAIKRHKTTLYSLQGYWRPDLFGSP